MRKSAAKLAAIPEMIKRISKDIQRNNIKPIRNIDTNMIKGKKNLLQHVYFSSL